MGLGGVATAALPSVVRLQMVFSDRLGGSNTKISEFSDICKHWIIYCYLMYCFLVKITNLII